MGTIRSVLYVLKKLLRVEYKNFQKKECKAVALLLPGVVSGGRVVASGIGADHRRR